MPLWNRAIACLIGATAVISASDVVRAQSVRIGVLLPVTGPFAKNGIENWEAMQIARDMINERGGINGRKIEYLQGDATSPNAAISETERLITKDGIKITTGSFASPLAIAVSQAAERHGVFHWETTGAAEIITRRGFKHTFQVGAPARKYSQAAVDFVIDDLAKRLNKPVGDLRIALLWENRAFGKSVGDGVRAYAERRTIKLVYDEGYDQFATDMTPIVQKLKDVKPDVLIAISFPNDAILFQRKAKEIDFNVGAFIGVSAGYSSPDLRNSIGDAVVGPVRLRLPAQGERQRAQARGPQGRRRVQQALRGQDEAAAGRPCVGRLLGDLGAVHRGAARRPRPTSRTNCARSRSSSICRKARWSTAAASSSPISTGRRTRRTPARTCAPRSACGSGPRTATSRSSRHRWRPRSRPWCRCRRGTSAELT